MANRRSRAQWKQLMEDHQSSGLSQKAFCQQQAISVATFGYWKRKLKQETDAQEMIAGSMPAPWLELPAQGITGGASSQWQIELDLGNGVCLRLTQVD